jgi:putative tryptophan/tyrosine transport system substrate-binding protein
MAFNVSDPQVHLELDAALPEAHSVSLDDVKVEFRPHEHFLAVIEPLRGGAGALYVCLDPFVITNAARINALALAARLPVMHGTRTNTEAGGLISYGPDFAGMSRRAAEIVDKILRSAKPAATARSAASKCHGVVASRTNHIEGSRPWVRLAQSVSILRSRSFRFTALMRMVR